MHSRNAAIESETMSFSSIRPGKQDVGEKKEENFSCIKNNE